MIDFVEKEKAGSTIPLHNTAGRLLAMLGIGENSLFRLKKELVDQRQKQRDEQEKQQFIRSRRRTTFNNESAWLHRKHVGLPPPTTCHLLFRLHYHRTRRIIPDDQQYTSAN